MNKNFLIILVILLLVIIGGGIIYSTSRNPSSNQNAATPNAVQNNNNNVQFQAAAPLAVTDSSVSPSATTAIVSGTVNPNGAFTSYWYEYGKTSGLGTKTPNQIIGSGFVAIQAPAYITNLSKNTTYYFMLVAQNQLGKVAGNQYTFKTTEATPQPVGSAPTTKTTFANSISSTTANLTGEVTPNKNETQYWFEYGKTSQLGNTSPFFSAGNGANKSTVSISLSDLEPDTTYYYRLNAQNQFGTVNGSILSFQTKK